MNHHLPLWRHLAVWIVVGSVVGCTAAPAAVPPPQRLSFDTMFVRLGSAMLATDSVTELRQVNTGRVLGGAVVLSDPAAGDIKIFDLASGRLRRVVGAPGDGPGEMRHVVAIAPAGPGQFAVLDQKRRAVAFRDTAGRMISEAALHTGAFHSLVVLPAQRRMVLSGTMWESGPGKGFDLHEFDVAGRRLKSFAASPAIHSRWEDAFGATFVDRAGGDLIEGSVKGNRLRVFDLMSSKTGEFSVARGWYKELIWPPEEAIKRGYSQQTASEIGTAWMRKQRMMNGVYALGGQLMLVRFQAFGPDGARFFYYATVDSAGRTLGVSAPTRAMVFDTHADTAYWVVGATGSFRVSHGVLRRNPARG